MTSAVEQAVPVIEQPSRQDAAARSQVYSLLAEAFAYPQGGSVIRMLDGDWLAEFNDALARSPLSLPTVPALETPDSKNAIADLQVTYTTLFDVTAGTPMVSLLERRYGDRPEQKLWQELLAFYAHFGLDFAQAYAPEQPDHLLTELGFMHYLSFLEAGSPAEKAGASLRRGQRDFLRLHLGAWAGELSSRLQSTTHEHPYAALGEVLADVLAADARHLDHEIAE